MKRFLANEINLHNAKNVRPITLFYSCHAHHLSSVECSFPLAKFNVREPSLLMVGVGTEEGVLRSLQKNLTHHLLKSNFRYPMEGKQ